jgi:hypothetical protein
MSDQPMRLAELDDVGLEGMLRATAAAIAWPTATPSGAPDLATRVRVRLLAAPPAPQRRPWTTWRPVRRGLVLALAALLALAAIAGAVGLGLPGLRLILGEPSASPPPTLAPTQSPPPGPLGSTLRLGDAIALDQVATLTGILVRLPTDPAIGPPDAVYVDPNRGNQVAYVWAASDALPESNEPGIGLILMQFDGHTEDEYHQKLIGQGVHIEPVTVDGHDGLWLSGTAHFFFYVRENGAVIDDDRRWVGDALLWNDGTTTYRIESALGRDATIALAESMD